MHEFYFKDKHSNISFRGIAPSNDVDCDPLDYFRITFAYHMFRQFDDMLKIKCPEPIPEKVVFKFVLNEVDKLIAHKLSTTASKPEIHQLLSDQTLDKHQQVNLLKGMVLKSEDLLWMNKEACDLGYLLDVYREETYPERYKGKQHPFFFHKKKDGTLEKIGKTDLTEGEMKALLQERKVVQARIYHKADTWHCFYFTYKGLFGQENGPMGSKPHYHYISDKFCITWDELMRRIKRCDMPSSKVHVIIERTIS